MKIGINSLFFKFPTNGSAQYLSYLVRALGEVDRQNEYILLGPQPLSQGSNSLTSFPYLTKPVPGFAASNENVAKLIWEQYTGPAAAHKAGVDIFHVPYFAPPYFPRTPTVVTIHDVIPLRLPLYRSGVSVTAYMKLVARAAHKATLVIAISQHAKQDMIDALQLPAERIRVIYQAAGDEYQPVTDAAKLAEVRERYGVGSRYILYLGGLDARKNVPQLVKAFTHVYRRLGDPSLQLLIAGNPEKQSGPLFPDPRPVASDLGMTGQIVYRFIEEEDKPAIYSGASVFVFPSLYEGFGLTPLEAMSCGTPVICSNRTSLPEVVGDAAISLNPDDTHAMVEAMCDVLTKSDLRADLRERSLQRATRFNWHKTAAETVAAYDEAHKRSKKK